MGSWSGYLSCSGVVLGEQHRNYYLVSFGCGTYLVRLIMEFRGVVQISVFALQFACLLGLCSAPKCWPEYIVWIPFGMLGPSGTSVVAVISELRWCKLSCTVVGRRNRTQVDSKTNSCICRNLNRDPYDGAWLARDPAPGAAIPRCTLWCFATCTIL